MTLKVERDGRGKLWLVDKPALDQPSLKIARFISLEAAISWKFAHQHIQRPPRKTARTAR